MIETPKADSLVAKVEEVLDDFLFDFQAEILQKAIARIPKRQAEYNAQIERDNALGELSIAVREDGLSWQEQTAVFRRMKSEFVISIRGKNVKGK